MEFEFDRELAHVAGIADLPKHIVLWELWRQAKPDQAVVNRDRPINSVEDIQKRINSQDHLSFGWLDGRALDLTISGDYVDLALYDEKNEISGVQLIIKLRKALEQICRDYNIDLDGAADIYAEKSCGNIQPTIKRRGKSPGMILLDKILFGDESKEQRGKSSDDL